ncbi:methylenetetrahydrofolate reductase [NAD(P)H] [Gammaproteobacteria bacterium]|nr:methylenetetrahydrofolate reductase [NAD(P)H] [Gammaproteobacteria bacterium]
MSPEKLKNISIEFYPPRTKEGEENLERAHSRLAALKPDFFSITYGAGGSTKKGTKNLVLRLKEKGSNVAPHLSFTGIKEKEIRKLLKIYIDAGINKIVALRGDLPSGSAKANCYAKELVEFIRKETGNHFHIDVACYPEVHPESDNIKSEVNFFKQKVEAGANSAITQYFYNVDSYFRFRDYCCDSGVTIPIFPGIMPITNYRNLARFSKNCGAEIPRWLHYRLDELVDDRSGLHEFGVEVVSRLCEKLLADDAPGLHFYSMNLSKSIIQIWDNLRLSPK